VKRKFAVSIKKLSDVVYHVWAETSDEASKVAVGQALSYDCPNKIVNSAIEHCSVVEIEEDISTSQTHYDDVYDDSKYQW
jgi:hypothetical protein